MQRVMSISKGIRENIQNWPNWVHIQYHPFQNHNKVQIEGQLARGSKHNMCYVEYHGWQVSMQWGRERGWGKRENYKSVFDNQIMKQYTSQMKILLKCYLCYGLFWSIVLSLLIQTYPQCISNYLQIICTTGPFTSCVYSHAHPCKCLPDLSVI